METLKLSQKSLNRAIVVINNGGVIVFPTDTVYGFLADATNKKAVEKIFRIKKRPKSKPLAVFVSGIKQAKQLAEINREQEKILRRYWPGKYTFILKSKIKNQKSKIYGIDKKTIALRIPKYRPLNDLLKKINPVRNGVSNGVNKPLAQTSVNISGNPPITKIEEIKKGFGSKPGLDLIIDEGDLKKSRPSVIIDLSGKKNKFLRK